MALAFRSDQTLRGNRFPRRRFTGWAVLYFVLLLCLPVLGLAFLLDLALYFVFDHFLDRCYGLLCLME